MATAATLAIARPEAHATPSSWRMMLAWIICTGLPLGLFGLLNLGGEAIGIQPLFFAPFGIPGWIGAVAHLGQLALLGSAYWALTQRDGQSPTRFWLVALIAGYIALPFVTPPLDSLQLSLVCTGLFLASVATISRVGAVSPLAAWMMAPMLAVLGFSATMGLAIAAAYAPPFALMQAHQAPSAA